MTVVAVLQARPGLGRQVIESLRAVSPLVHDEPGCELSAAHLEEDGDAVVMVERWTFREALDAHAAGASLRRLDALNADLLARPYDVRFLDAVPLGHPEKGTVPAPNGQETA